MSDTAVTIFYPGYIQIINRKPNGWFQSCDELFKLSDREFDWANREQYFGLTKGRILTELFRKYQGKLGYYLVHLAKQEYHYCGMELEDVQQKLWDIGITRRDPVERSDG
ncbi:conserved hypothetical protein [Hyella patelloides LEGE 07179]|uniref:Uncharacterized protein n=1 Tax=Hyella patelloides LEGE 07179 TaxID=945734 RepID=A0A563W5H6_9CYAN|nr:hypothetical protein [Hyella patelloides]VEP18936.1 conserved hypothetical protein [Hyella patelloides LEGE 07179]